MGLWDLKKVINLLFEHRDVTPRDVYNDAIWIWEEGMHFPAGQEKDLTTEAEIKLTKIIERIRQGEPVQYVIGHAWFYGLKFLVTPDVLIPRPETEELVNWILDDVKNTTQPLRILDIGTGSGCIAITLKHHLKEMASVAAMDISVPALKVAKENAVNLGVAVDFIEKDFLKDGLAGMGTWDIIVSNPPYISAGDSYEAAHPELMYEPDIALYPPGHPDQFYILMSEILPQYLSIDGSAYLEMNEFRAEVIEDYFKNGPWHSVETRKDMQGKSRMLKASRVKGT